MEDKLSKLSRSLVNLLKEHVDQGTSLTIGVADMAALVRDLDKLAPKPVELVSGFTALKDMWENPGTKYKLFLPGYFSGPYYVKNGEYSYVDGCSLAGSFPTASMVSVCWEKVE